MSSIEMVGALLGPGGLRFGTAHTAGSLTPGWPWAAGYAIMSLCFFVARWITVPVEDDSR